jgi:hypothetical protein
VRLRVRCHGFFEAARILWKHLRTARPDLPEERFQGLAFTDVVFGHPYAVPVQNLFLLGVIERTENRRFNPDEPIKRRDFVRWLTRAGDCRAERVAAAAGSAVAVCGCARRRPRPAVSRAVARASLLARDLGRL